MLKHWYIRFILVRKLPYHCIGQSWNRPHGQYGLESLEFLAPTPTKVLLRIKSRKKTDYVLPHSLVWLKNIGRVHVGYGQAYPLLGLFHLIQKFRESGKFSQIDFHFIPHFKLSPENFFNWFWIYLTNYPKREKVKIYLAKVSTFSDFKDKMKLAWNWVNLTLSHMDTANIC